MKNTHFRVRSLIRDVRDRWRRRALLQGIALSGGVLAVCGTLLLLLHGSVSSYVMGIGLVISMVALLGTVVRYVIQPALRPISDRDVALYVEERLPELEDRLNAAVEIDDPDAARRAHGVLVDHLIDDAAERARTLPLATLVDRSRERILAGVSAAGLLVFLILGYQSIDELRVSLAAGTLVPTMQSFMTIDPGDVEIEQGASQSIVVSLREETGRDVVIHFRPEGGTWQQSSMQKAIGEPSFLHEFLDVQEPIEYFVEHDERRSDAFAISLYTFPAVAQIDLTYTFPSYTGRAPEREVDTGDIRGVKGTVVTLNVTTTGTAEKAELVLDDGRTIALASGDNGQFSGRMKLESSGFYSVLVTDSEEKSNKFPDEYRITAVDDQPPLVTVTIPQRDVRANAVEEVLVAARAEDDFGLRDVRLRYAVNGGDEETISLKPVDASRPLEAEGEHLFFLEDFSLEPGDVISYFAEAEDFSGGQPEATDIYFVEVIPFDQEYTQVAGGGGAVGGGQSGIVLSQQQIIAATWNLHRERDSMDPAEHASSRRALAQAQNNLRLNIVQRISETSFSVELQRTEGTREIAELLRGAADAMKEAVEELEADRLREALKPEREALNNLLKADAQNRERQIALNRGGQPGGGGSTEERMTELMDLELDISKDKYEIMPQSSGASGAAAMDEALQKLQELARRQEALAEQSRKPLEGEDPRRQVERLQRDQEELQQQAEALANRIQQMARENGSLSEQSREQMERAAQRMQEAEQALREGNVDQARASQQRAVNDLERVSRDLRMAGGEGQRRMLEEMDRDFDDMRAKEEQLANDLQQTAERAAGGRVSPTDLERLAEQRRALRERLERLRDRADALAGAEDPDLAATARDVERSIQRSGLDEQMAESEHALRRGWLDNAIRRENPIQEGLERLEESMQAFDGQLPVTEEETLARSLDAVRDLERELRELEELAAQAGEPARDSPSAPGTSATQDSQAQQDAPSSQNARGNRAGAARREARMERIRDQLARLEEELQNSPDGRPLGGIRSALSRADNPNSPISGEEAREFFNEEVFSPLSQLEASLVRALDQIAMERKLRGSRPNDVPAEYRDLVEKYYEALSRSSAP